MRDFDWNEFQKGEISVNCRTVKHAQNFINTYFSRLINRPYNTKKFVDMWYIFKEKTCYLIKQGDIGISNEDNSSVVEWKLERKECMFNKKDLEGKFVELRNGKRGIVLNSHIKAKGKGLIELGWYNEDLQETYGDEKWDIIKIFRIEDRGGVLDLFNDPEKYAELIWERKEVDWKNVPKYNKVQVRDNDDEKWKNAYLIKYNESHKYQFEVTFNLQDEFTGIKGTIYNYKYCRLYKED